MEITKIYQAERALLGRKFPTLGFAWETRQLIEQLVSPLLERSDADFAYQKLAEGLRPKASAQLDQLLQVVEVDKRRALCRLVIAVRILRDCFGDELPSSDGGGGGRKNRLNPLARFSRF